MRNEIDSYTQGSDWVHIVSVTFTCRCQKRYPAFSIFRWVLAAPKMKSVRVSRTDEMDEEWYILFPVFLFWDGRGWKMTGRLSHGRQEMLIGLCSIVRPDHPMEMRAAWPPGKWTCVHKSFFDPGLPAMPVKGIGVYHETLIPFNLNRLTPIRTDTRLINMAARMK